MGASCCTIHIGLPAAACAPRAPGRTAGASADGDGHLARIVAAAALALPLLLPELAAAVGLDIRPSGWDQLALALPIAAGLVWRRLVGAGA